jgi:lipopolysaccharide assembly outer membrane protein LptD (OstA)
MKKLAVCALLLCSTLTFGSQIRRTLTPIPRFPKLNIQSNTVTRAGGVERYAGGVEMVSDEFVIRADELDFNTANHTAELRGNVSVQLLPAC